MIRDSSAKRIWLHMLAEGGRWSVRELAMDTRLDYGSANSAATAMYDSGSVVRHEKAGEAKTIQYSVTQSCYAPQGISVSEFVEAARKAMALP